LLKGLTDALSLFTIKGILDCSRNCTDFKQGQLLMEKNNILKRNARQSIIKGHQHFWREKSIEIVSRFPNYAIIITFHHKNDAS